MKIRGLITGLLLALAVTGCTGSPTTSETPLSAPAFDEVPPPPPDTTTNRSGGTMGTGT